MHEKIITLGEKIHDALVEYVIENKVDSIGKDLCGACAIGSALLTKEIRYKLMLPAQFYCAPNHAWVEYRDYIYDVTATQFGYSGKVRVMSLKEVQKFARNSKGKNRKGGYYHYLMKTYGLKEVNKNWPDDQRPGNYELKWVNQHKARVIAHN